MLLDTTILIDALRRRPRTLGRLRALGPPVFASVISVQEVIFGMHSGEEERTELLIESLELLPIGQSEARLAGGWRREYAKAGKTLHPGDCLIAATAATSGLTLATANLKDFPMPDLLVEHWPSE